MARAVEIEATTVEEAIIEALDELGVERSKVKIEVLEEEKKGFFGRNSKARVRVSVVEDGVDKTVALIKDVLRTSNISGDIEVVEGDDIIKLNITGADLGVLIGKRGETLSSLQTIANIVLRKSGTDKKLIIDIENYRERRAQSLAEMARQAADKAVRYGKAITLEPMNSYDRRMVHLALQDNNKVYTVSEGEEPSRQIIIIPKK